MRVGICIYIYNCTYICNFSTVAGAMFYGGGASHGVLQYTAPTIILAQDYDAHDVRHCFPLL